MKPNIMLNDKYSYPTYRTNTAKEKMKCIKPTSFVVLALLSGCAGNFPEKQIYKGYSGAEKHDNELALYSLLNIPSFLSSKPTITTLEIDGVDYQNHPASSPAAPSLGAVGLVRLLPGKHNIKVSFVDFDILFIPSWIDTKTFQGFYEFDFITRSSMFYAPVYKTLDDKNFASEICIAEIKQSSGNHTTLRKLTWEITEFVQCSSPSIEPTEENIKLCRQIRAGVPTQTIDDACMRISEQNEAR